jgi:hypothetical protein
LAKQVAQPVVLAGELIALFDEPPFSARSASRSAQAVSTSARSAARSSGRESGVVTPGIISCRQRYAILNRKVSQRDAGL